MLKCPVPNKLRIKIPCSAKNFLEVGASLLLKAVTKAFVRGKKYKNLALLRLFL